jgi:uncharacterized protein YjbI with pentapeptide repeats
MNLSKELIAFYARKGARIAFKNKGREITKIIPADTWTVIEDITDITQVFNFSALKERGISTYRGSFRSTPPFGQSGGGQRFCVIEADTDTPIFGLYSDFLSHSKNAAAEVKNAIFVEKLDVSRINFSKVDFSKVDFSKVDWRSAKVSVLDFSAVDFTAIDFSKINFDKFDYKNASGAANQKVEDGREMVVRDGEKVDTYVQDFKLASFAYVDFRATEEIEMDPADLDFSKVDFSKVDFSKVNFNGLSLDKVDLTAFNTARIEDMKKIFGVADFSKVDFSKLDFSKVDFAAGDIFGFVAKSKGGYGAKYDFSKVDFSRLSFANVNFNSLEFVGL